MAKANLILTVVGALLIAAAALRVGSAWVSFTERLDRRRLARLALNAVLRAHQPPADLAECQRIWPDAPTHPREEDQR